jgi:hypothetical protein
MARFASGKKSKAISDISGAKVPYTQLKTTWNNLRVEPSEFDPKHPQLTPAKNVIDATALYDPRPSTDVENVVIDFAFTSNIFLSRVERSQVGTNIHARGNVGTVSTVIEEEQTGVVGTTAIGAFAPGVGVSGVAGTTAIGNFEAQDQIDVDVTEVGATSAIGAFGVGVGITGVQATGGTGTETITHDRIFELPNGGSVGTGAIGTSAPQTDVISTNIAGTGGINNSTVGNEPNATGVQATGGIGTFGEEGDGTLNLTITPVSATGTANAGAEVAESEIPESNTNGWGENPFGYAEWGGDGEVKATGGVGESSIDIFKGPNPVDAVQGTTALGAYLVQGNLTVTGVAGTGGVGTVSLDTDVDTTGVAGTGAIGAESVVIDGGFGEGTYGSGTWGN